MEVWAQLERQRVHGTGGRVCGAGGREFAVQEAECLHYVHEDLD